VAESTHTAVVGAGREAQERSNSGKRRRVDVGIHGHVHELNKTTAASTAAAAGTTTTTTTTAAAAAADDDDDDSTTTITTAAAASADQHDGTTRNTGTATATSVRVAKGRVPSSDVGSSLSGGGRIQWWDSQDDAAARDRGARLLERLLGIPIATFEAEHLFRKPFTRLLSPAEREAAAADPGHPMHMLTLADSDVLLRRQSPARARFTDDVDVTRWVDGRRVALTGGKEDVDADRVWEAFNSKGYSMRLVHPQQWHDPLWELCGSMQE
jgi:hypothetical protein